MQKVSVSWKVMNLSPGARAGSEKCMWPSPQAHAMSYRGLSACSLGYSLPYKPPASTQWKQLRKSFQHQKGLTETTLEISNCWSCFPGDAPISRLTFIKIWAQVFPCGKTCAYHAGALDQRLCHPKPERDWVARLNQDTSYIWNSNKW